MNLPIIFRFFSLIFRFELFCVRAKSTDNRLMIWNNRPMSHSTGNLSIIYRRFDEIYRKYRNLRSVKSTDNRPIFFC